MIILIIISIIYIYILTKQLVTISKIKKIKDGHVELAFKMAKTNNYKHLESSIISSKPHQEMLKASEEDSRIPLVNLDDNLIRHIVFTNNITMAEANDDKGILTISLNTKNKDDSIRDVFVTNNYQLKQFNKKLSEILTLREFPRIYNNVYENIPYINLKDLGYDRDISIKMDKIASMTFTGTRRSLKIRTSIIELSEFDIKYKSKKDIIDIIKKTKLKEYIKQWGVVGYNQSEIYKLNSKGERVEDDVE